MLPELKNKALKVGVLSVFFLFFLLLCCQCNCPFFSEYYFLLFLKFWSFNIYFLQSKSFLEHNSCILFKALLKVKLGKHVCTKYASVCFSKHVIVSYIDFLYVSLRLGWQFLCWLIVVKIYTFYSLFPVPVKCYFIWKQALSLEIHVATHDFRRSHNCLIKKIKKRLHNWSYLKKKIKGRMVCLSTKGWNLVKICMQTLFLFSGDLIEVVRNICNMLTWEFWSIFPI